jgi:hypothetical protein
MKARGPLFLLVCVLVALPAETASARPGYVVKPKSLHLNLALPATDGYSAFIRTSGHRQVILSVAKGDFTAAYVALGRVTRKGIRADFGPLGHVSLRFRGKAKYHPKLAPGLKLPPSLRDRCKGRRTVGEKGVFLGSVRFHGERGYMLVHTHRRNGTVVRSYRRVCRSPARAGASAAGPREEGVFFGAQARRSGRVRFLTGVEMSFAVAREESAVTFVVSGERKKVGRVAAFKLFIDINQADSVEISPRGKKPLTAEVKLPKPFVGKASYVREGKAPPSWSGTLGIHLPGSRRVRLTGPEFDAELCRAFRPLDFDRCSRSVFSPEPFTLDTLLRLQGSGSHSQPLALARLSSLR